MWFTVSIMMKSSHPESTIEEEHLYEEIIVLANASSAEEATKKAIGSEAVCNHQFQAASGELVNWTFEKVLFVFELFDDHLKDGIEIFSRFLDIEQVQALSRHACVPK